MVLNIRKSWSLLSGLGPVTPGWILQSTAEDTDRLRSLPSFCPTSSPVWPQECLFLRLWDPRWLIALRMGVCSGVGEGGKVAFSSFSVSTVNRQGDVKQFLPSSPTPLQLPSSNHMGPEINFPGVGNFWEKETQKTPDRLHLSQHNLPCRIIVTI